MATKRTKRTASRKPIRRTRRAAGTPWTREELAFLRRYYRNNETAWVARQLGRTVYSIRYKASDMNIKKANPSVWKGNKGVVKGRKAASRPTPRRKSVRRTTKRRYASPKRRISRKTTSRRRTSRRRSMRRR